MLEQKYQERLDRWQKKSQETPQSQKERHQKHNFFVPRKDYGDDFSEKELEMIKKNLSKVRE